MSWVPKNPLAAVLERVARATAAVAAVAVVAPDPVGAALAGVVVAIVVAAPIVRVAWLARTWRREGDTGFAAAAVALLAVIAAGSALGLLT